jgi:hypothetical protein
MAAILRDNNTVLFMMIKGNVDLFAGLARVRNASVGSAPAVASDGGGFPGGMVAVATVALLLCWQEM